ncbi:MAG: hypothetical protein HYT76_00040 [Deltaproteobacteria bacterium]|nr:hypothetical protein [Deltaproteobacteria bacterium]
MQIKLTESFQRDVGSLSDEEQAQLFSVMLKVPAVLKNPHLHSGLGLRKIHRSGVFEARIGLGLRVLFGFEPNAISFHRVGNHDDIQRYLKSL